MDALQGLMRTPSASQTSRCTPILVILFWEASMSRAFVSLSANSAASALRTALGALICIELVGIVTSLGFTPPWAPGSEFRGTIYICNPTILYVFCRYHLISGLFKPRRSPPWKTSSIGFYRAWKRGTASSTCIEMPSHNISFFSLLDTSNGNGAARRFGPTAYVWNASLAFGYGCLEQRHWQSKGTLGNYDKRFRNWRYEGDELK